MPGFQVGTTGELDGFRYEVRAGRKDVEGDKVLYAVRLEPGPVKMSLGALFADFFYENEELLYPPPQYMGGKKYLTFISRAARHGHWIAVNELRSEQARRNGDGLPQLVPSMLVPRNAIWGPLDQDAK